MQAPDPVPASAPKVLQETVCECGQPIIVLQQGKLASVMHKKPACRAWEQRKLDGTRGLNRGRVPQPSQQPTNRHARRRAQALARRGVKP